jgi:hypothetical protein
MTADSSRSSTASASSSPVAVSGSLLTLQELSDAFSKGAVSVFQIQFGLEAKLSGEAKRTGPSFAGPVLVGFGEIKSLRGGGEVGVVLPEPEFLKLMSGLLGSEATIVTPEIEDGACEILNMVFGLAKDELNRSGAGVQPVRPRLVRGLEWENRWEKAPEGRAVRFEISGIGSLALEFFAAP